MALATLETILGARNLTGLIQKTKTRVPKVLGDEWFKVTRKTHGNTAEYITAPGQRTLARQTSYGSVAKSASMRNIGGVPTVLLHTFERLEVPATVLLNLLAPDSTDQGMRQEMGMQEVVRQLGAFKDKFENLRTTVPQMQLFTNHLYFDKDGNVLATSSGNVFDAGPGIPAANTVHITAGGYTAGLIKDWENPATDIIGQLQALQQLAIKLTGFPIQQVHYGVNMPGYIASNTTAQQYLRYQLQMNAEYVRGGQIPQGFGGIPKWVPTGQAFYATEDAAGAETIVSYADADTCIFTPDPDPSWYEVIEGTYPVPRSIDVKSSAELAYSDFEEVAGQFSFAHASYNPPALEMFFGDTFAAQIRNPNVVFQGVAKSHT